MNIFTIISMVMQILPSVLSAIEAIQKDTGKPWEQVVVDVIDHLTPGKPNSPVLTGSAPPVLSTTN